VLANPKPSSDSAVHSKAPVFGFALGDEREGFAALVPDEIKGGVGGRHSGHGGAVLPLALHKIWHSGPMACQRPPLI